MYLLEQRNKVWETRVAGQTGILMDKCKANVSWFIGRRQKLPHLQVFVNLQCNKHSFDGD